MVISSRTPEGRPNRCPVCGSDVRIEPSDPAGEAPCPDCGHLLWFTWEDAGDTVVLKPTCSILRSEDLDTLIDNSSEKRGVRLVLDLGSVQHLESAALASLINLKKKVMGVSGKLRIENLHPDVHEVFRITRLDRVFDIGR
jgi:anti-sigma B factor antagonist